MFRFLLTRLAGAAVAALLSSLAVFLLMRAVPGDIVSQMLGQSGNDRTAEQALRGFFGLDRPVWAQFGDWLGATLSGDLGRSWYQGRAVTMLVWDAFLVTAEIAVAMMFDGHSYRINGSADTHGEVHCFRHRAGCRRSGVGIGEKAYQRDKNRYGAPNCAITNGRLPIGDLAGMGG